MVAACKGKDVVILYIVGFEATSEDDPIDKVNEKTERHRLGIGTKWWSNALNNDDNLY